MQLRLDKATIDKGKEKMDRDAKTDRISVSTTKRVSKSTKTAEREDSGGRGSERYLDRNHI
jgi:hypothetical protein